jgi:hypothetical protein
MDAQTITHWVKNLGRHYEILVTEGAIPDAPLSELYTGRDWLTLKPGKGLELLFWAQTKRLETLNIVLLTTMEGMTSYEGELPEPFLPVMDQSSVRAAFGPPMASKGFTRLPLNTAIGGWDAYLLDPGMAPNTKLILTYADTMQVKTLTFTLVDRGHD